MGRATLSSLCWCCIPDLITSNGGLKRQKLMIILKPPFLRKQLNLIKKEPCFTANRKLDYSSVYCGEVNAVVTTNSLAGNGQCYTKK